MGLFNKSSPAAAAAGPGAPRPAQRHGHAALDPADIEDARRGRPAISLETFAAAHGLTYRDAELPGAFLATLPTWPDYLFNGCRGALPGGRFGMVVHELMEVEVSNGIRMSGGFYDVRAMERHGIGEVLGLSVSDPEDAPFAANAVWVPTTTVHVRTPETALLPALRITHADRLPLIGNPTLDAWGLPGFRALGSRFVDEAMLAAIATACRPWLMARIDPYTSLRVRYGVVALTINGFRTDHADLAHLIAIAEGLANALAQLMAPASGAAFDAPGAAVGTIASIGVPQAGSEWVTAFQRDGAKLSMFPEAPAHLMTMAPRSPVPGVAKGVLFGRLPGSPTVGRLTWHDPGGRTSDTVRGGAVVAARPGATTPLGGTLDTATRMYVEVVDGLAFCWNQARSVRALETDALVANAVETFRRSGVTDV